MYKIGNFGIFVLRAFQNKIEREISHLIYNSKHYDKICFETD